MLKTQLYMIYDVVADDFGPVFEVKNEEVAKRSFFNLLKGKDIDQGDYALYKVCDLHRERMFSDDPVVVDVKLIMRGFENKSKEEVFEDERV